MGVPILVCECGMRIRAPGSRPGRVGRCPACGERLEVPDSSSAADKPDVPIGLADIDRGFGPVGEIEMTSAFTRTIEPSRKRRRAASEQIGRTPMADGILPVQKEPERAWATSFVYPMRGAESLAVIASIGILAWIFAVLIPEYCLQAMKDTTAMGASLLGTLFVLIAGLPVLFLGPLVLIYWLQYLGRVLVSSAIGESVPPRMPDRNFDGFFSGMSPWFVWAILGLSVGVAPASCWVFTAERTEASLAWPVIILAAVGLPHILAALMLSFLHDDALAAAPWGVMFALIRLGPGFLFLSGVIASAFAAVAGSLVLVLWTRAHLFWPYLLIALAWWIVFLWVQMAAMRLLGVFYYHRKDLLGWNRAHPRWGVAWRL